MDDKIKELEAQIMSLSFMNDFLMDKLNSDIKKCNSLRRNA